MIYNFKNFLFILLSLFLFQTKAEVAVPVLRGPVMDQALLMDEAAKNNITNAVISFRRNHGPQIQVLTINNLEGESIEGFSIRVFESWKLGDRENDNGLLLVISKEDKKIRIEVGGGLEGIFPDLKAHYVIEKMKPYFAREKFGKGVEAGVGQIIEALNDPETYSEKIKKSEMLRSYLPFILIILFIIISVLHNKYVRNHSSSGGLRDRGGWGSNGGRGGYHGSHSSGGGTSWGGGGGRSSGGGASGGW